MQGYGHSFSASSTLKDKSLPRATKDYRGKEHKCSSLLLRTQMRNRVLQDRLKKLEKKYAALQLEQAALTVHLFFCPAPPHRLWALLGT